MKCPNSFGKHGMQRFALLKQAYSNILKILPPKNENFQIKILIFFLFLLKKIIDCGTRWNRIAEAVLTTHNMI